MKPPRRKLKTTPYMYGVGLVNYVVKFLKTGFAERKLGDSRNKPSKHGKKSKAGLTEIWPAVLTVQGM